MLKLDIKTNSNMPNSMVMFTFFVLDQNYPFWTNFVKKNQTSWIKLKFSNYINSCMQN